MIGPRQLDLEAALAAKQAGLERVEGTHPDFLPVLREVAKAISRRCGSVHIDDVRSEALARGWRPRSPHAWGALFRGPGWIKVGARPSTVISNHGHVSPCWKWTGPI